MVELEDGKGKRQCYSRYYSVDMWWKVMSVYYHCIHILILILRRYGLALSIGPN
jgi:hypothetical protein